MNRVAIIGTSFAAAIIAADMVNCGVSTYLLNLSKNSDDDRNIYEILFNDRGLNLDTLQNIDCNSLNLLKDIDWIIDCNADSVDVNLSLYKQISAYLKDDVIISFNTSTANLALICSIVPKELLKNVIVLYFFEYSYMSSVLEVVVHENNFDTLLNKIKKFCFIKLGKEIVVCKDIYGLIANRINCFWIITVIIEAFNFNVSIENVDEIIANLYVGIIDCGVFKLLDRLGIENFFKLTSTIISKLSDDDLLSVIYKKIPDTIFHMIHDGNVGNNSTLGGFYRKYDIYAGSIDQVIDLRSGLYRIINAFDKKDFFEKPMELLELFNLGNNFGNFCYSIIYKTLLYIEFITDSFGISLIDIDKIMRFVCNWKYCISDLRILIKSYQEKDLIFERDDKIEYHEKYDGTVFANCNTKELGFLSSLTVNKNPILKNFSASLWDIGDGVACFEFNSKYNKLSIDTFSLLFKSLDVVSRGFRGMIIGNDSIDFSQGIGLKCCSSNNVDLDDLLKYVQEVLMELKFSKFPVVAAVSGLAAGAACDLFLHCDAVQFHVNFIMQLFDVDCKTFSGCGAYKEMIVRFLASGSIKDLINFIIDIKCLKSIQQMQKLNFYRKSDGLTIDRKKLLSDAKKGVISLSMNYYAPSIIYDIKVDEILLAENDIFSYGITAFIDGLFDILRTSNGKSEVDILKMERELIVSLT